MSRFLEDMALGSHRRLDEAKTALPPEGLEERLASGPKPRTLSGFGRSFDVIAELKPRSPSEGSFEIRDPVATARAYEAGGAAMLSVLTEPDAFGGSLDELTLISAAAAVPVMAKDFLVDPYQVGQARLAGADGVLIIVRMLESRVVAAMLETASRLGMFCLMEAFDVDDMTRISDFDLPGGVLVGVNCRDLVTLEVRPERHRELASLLPEGVATVAESGIESETDVERVTAAGYGSVLVGSALMRSAEPDVLVRSLIDAGRTSRVGS
jgi:indole-3-glycerol phosphate synthase